MANNNQYDLPKGFERVTNSTAARRIIVAISGREKHGKTHLALTAPDPIAFFDMDIGTEGVIERAAAAGKVILRKEYDYHAIKDRAPGPIAIEKFVELWEKFRLDYIAAMDSKVRSIVVDTASELWELLRLARFGKLLQVMPHHYGPVNAEYRAILRMAYMGNKNLILLHKMKQEYVNDKRTGQYERAGFNDTGFMVQVNTRSWRRLNDNGQLEFGMTVEDCRQDATLTGLDLVGDMCNFPTLASMVTGTDVSEWQ